MKTLVIAACMLSAGCSITERPSTDYEVYVDSSFTPEQDQEILNDLDAWVASVAPRKLTFHPSMLTMTCDNSCYNVITIHATTQAGLSSLDGNFGEDVLGYTHRRWHADALGNGSDYSNVYIATDVSSDAFHKITTHELGHALSLSHTASGIMCAGIGCETDGIAPIDVEQYDVLHEAL